MTQLTTFATASSATVPAGTDRVRTTGYSVLGKGAADYVYDAAVDASYVAANPRTAFRDVNGRGFRLSRDQVITPFAVGAAGWTPPAGLFNLYDSLTQVTYGCPDDQPALQTFFGLVFEQDFDGDATGIFGTTSTIFVGPAAARTCGGSIGGDFTVLALAGMADLTEFRNLINLTWNGSLRLGGIGGLDWSTRTVDTAINLKGNTTAFTVSGAVLCSTFRIFGINAITGSGEFFEWLSIPTLYGHVIGSGLIEGNPAYNAALAATYSGRSNQVGAWDTNQYTRLDVTALPPASLDNGIPGYVVADGRVYQIVNVDRTNGRIDIYPWLANSAPSTGTLHYMFGAVVAEGGGDGSLMQIDSLISTASSIGYKTDCLYPARIGSICAQSNCAAVVYSGKNQYSAGGVIGQLYSENCPFSVVAFAAAGGSCDNRILNYIGGEASGALFSKVVAPTRWNGDAGSDYVDRGLGDLDIGMANGWRFNQARRRDGLFEVYVDGRTEGPFAVQSDSCNFAIGAFDATLFRNLGINTLEVIVTGTGANGQPTGTIGFIRPAGKTINGVAGDASFASLAQPLHVVISADPGTGNLRIVRLKGLAAPGAAITGPAGGSTVDSEARTAIGTIIARLQSAGITV